ncbi:hypothetical protein SODALDRAFT_358770 [Sodiomyces alkalinus F11]|uniref:Uncharacterized protein n=1 Tax=Sodiomyces alkalinus (strain CBS 110278 / VKM F-3762 / F11) TaxID=1314773 RepID=A0A3N2PWQ0_SODAK|nr:hypothetical protein SODALDRAFT_358770 [Sodiomyces alkalinus F11]ROT38937.1 hypothetical protein SODALDRAFT_358770 [Sodiomyces alkalinus F11]
MPGLAGVVGRPRYLSPSTKSYARQLGTGCQATPDMPLAFLAFLALIMIWRSKLPLVISPEARYYLAFAFHSSSIRMNMYTDTNPCSTTSPTPYHTTCTVTAELIHKRGGDPTFCGAS